jgi:hypothetical protein
VRRPTSARKILYEPIEIFQPIVERLDRHALVLAVETLVTDLERKT